ncbi:MAG: hypothetical protein RR632_03870 [Christensenella sp.]
MEIKRNPQCSERVCPICGIRLAFDEGVCYCPAEYCGWKCDKCKKEAEENK